GVAWVHNTDGLVGWGRAAQIEVSGPDRFDEAQQWWNDVIASAVVRDDLDLPGSGLVAFGTFTFAEESAATSTLIVPEIVVGRRGSDSWVTLIGAGLSGVPPLTAHDEPPHPEPTFSDGSVDGVAWQ